MAINLAKIEELCLQGESSSLDYKREQYKFIGANDPDKVELLKDIIAMANSFGTYTAYILIGVNEEEGGKGSIVGILPAEFIDDAQLQQFINGKLNRTIEFSSYAVTCDNNRIVQVIEIPVQKQRPYYLKKKCVAINPQDVLLRMGSSSRSATPDEIARMGREEQAQQNRPVIEISLNIPQNRFDNTNILAYDISFDQMQASLSNKNCRPHYLDFEVTLEQKTDWLKEVFRTVRLDIALENKSQVAAEQLTIEPLVSQCSNRCITQQESFPTKPADFYNLNLPQINASFENLLRPGQFDPQYHSLYLRVNTSGDFTLEVTILGKNILPLKKSFHLNVKYEPYSLPVNKIDSLFEVIADEDIYVKFRRGEFENRETENE